jgi:hypothetical protein
MKGVPKSACAGVMLISSIEIPDLVLEIIILPSYSINTLLIANR